LPTFERPMNANSGSGDFGHDFRSGELTSKTADLIFMRFGAALLTGNDLSPNGFTRGE